MGGRDRAAPRCCKPQSVRTASAASACLQVWAGNKGSRRPLLQVADLAFGVSGRPWGLCHRSRPVMTSSEAVYKRASWAGPRDSGRRSQAAVQRWTFRKGAVQSGLTASGHADSTGIRRSPERGSLRKPGEVPAPRGRMPLSLERSLAVHKLVPAAALAALLGLAACGEGEPAASGVTTVQVAPSETSVMAEAPSAPATVSVEPSLAPSTDATPPPLPPPPAPVGMTKEEAGARYLEIVGPRNDASCAIVDYEFTEENLPAIKQVAGTAAVATRIFGERLVATDWPSDVQPVIDEIVVTVSGEIDYYRSLEAADSIDQVAEIDANFFASEAASNPGQHLRLLLGLPEAGLC